MVVRANLHITDKPLGADRGIFRWNNRADSRRLACAKIGAHELIYDVTFEKQAQTIGGWLQMMDTLRKLV